MASLTIATAAFLAIHFAISGTQVRDRLAGMLGEGTYLGLFSAASLALIVWMSMSYGPALADEANVILWTGPDWWPKAGGPLVLIAFLFMVIGMIGTNPGAVGQAERAADGPRGMQRITRHPFLWGVALWAAFHVVANGDLASLVLFGGFLVLALAGTVMIDAKRQRKMGETWQAYAAETSNIPFAAILGRRQRLVMAEFRGWQFILVFAIYGTVYALHAQLFGVSPA